MFNSYLVEIRETLQLSVECSAATPEEAEAIIQAEYKNGLYVLGAEDFVDVDFNVSDIGNLCRLGVPHDVVAIVNAPDIILADDENAGDVLPRFFRALGWSGEDMLDPSKIRTTKAVSDYLYDVMFEKCPEPITVGMAMVNRGPGTDDYVPTGKVCLLNGWIAPSEPEEAL